MLGRLFALPGPTLAYDRSWAEIRIGSPMLRVPSQDCQADRQSSRDSLPARPAVRRSD